MKKFLVALAVASATVEMFRTDGHALALVLSLVIAYMAYGKEIYKAWYKTFLMK